MSEHVHVCEVDGFWPSASSFYGDFGKVISLSMKLLEYSLWTLMDYIWVKNTSADDSCVINLANAFVLPSSVNLKSLTYPKV